MPSLVLLDLNIPKVPGFDVLHWIHCQPALKSIPVIVLSASDHPTDVKAALALGAAAYFVKPDSQSERLQLAKAIAYRLLQDDNAKTGEVVRESDPVWGRSRPEN